MNDLRIGLIMKDGKLVSEVKYDKVQPEQLAMVIVNLNIILEDLKEVYKNTFVRKGEKNGK